MFFRLKVDRSTMFLHFIVETFFQKDPELDPENAGFQAPSTSISF